MNLFFGEVEYHTTLYLKIFYFHFSIHSNLIMLKARRILLNIQIVRLKNNNSLNVCNILGLLKCKRILDLILKLKSVKRRLGTL